MDEYNQRFIVCLLVWDVEIECMGIEMPIGNIQVGEHGHEDDYVNTKTPKNYLRYSHITKSKRHAGCESWSSGLIT